MLDKIDNILQKQCQIHHDDLLLVGVSGGSDSLCLLHVLHQLRYSILTVHVNHKLRPEADQEVKVVRQLAQDLEIDFISKEANVLAYAREESLSVEEAARVLRYQLLFELARIHAAKAVVVAHNANDQVETILLHFLRGSGLNGLRGMEYHMRPNPWSDDIALIRPLISTWRDEIQKYLEVHHLYPVTDQSNLDKSFSRNRIRHELLPILEDYNPSIRGSIFRMGMHIRDDFDLLQEMTDKAWRSIFIESQKGYTALQTTGFIDQPASIQRYLLRKAIAKHIPGLHDVDFECIERGISMLGGEKSSSQIDLIAGLQLIKEGERFYVATPKADLPAGDFPAMQPGETIELQVPFKHGLNGDWELEVEEIKDASQPDVSGEMGIDPFQAHLDISALDTPLTLRARRKGDRIRPVGMNGQSQKISDVMINLKIPRRARETWPLVCSGAEIIWLPGYRISDRVKVGPGTKKTIKMNLRRLETT